MEKAGLGSTYANASLYVGDLDENVDERQLYDLFGQVAQVISIRVCRDINGRFSLGYAYVNFGNAEDAASAMELLNFSYLNGKPIRIMFSHRDPMIRRSGYANVFIKNLDMEIGNKELHETFTSFGAILSCKIAIDTNGKSKGYGFVQYEKVEDARKAIATLDGMLINGKQVFVGFFVRRQERVPKNGSPKFTNVFVKNFSDATTDEDLRRVFATYGSINSAVVVKDANGKSKCFGFVNFESSDSAATAIEMLNGTMINSDKVWYVGRAQRKSERQKELKARFEQERITRFEKLKGANLYLKNLTDDINDEKLRELFSVFGSISSCKVMVDESGLSKGCGFVAFNSPDEASKALMAMHGKMIGRKPVYVAVAQRKEERKVHLQAYFAQNRGAAAQAPLSSRFSGYHPGPPGVPPQQMYLGQGTHGLPPHQSCAYGFQQPFYSGIRPGTAPSFVMPYQLPRHGQYGPRLSVRRSGNHHFQPQQVLLRKYNQGSRYMSHVRNRVDPSVVPHGLMGPYMRVPVPSFDIQQHGAILNANLTAALASASKESSWLILGHKLYPLVAELEPEQASKITGMLLEMDQPEVLHLMESPLDLKVKVMEAVQVLQQQASATASAVGDQLSTLSLHD